MRSNIFADICIVGAGMVGMSVAHQILERFDSLSIVIIDKEADVGMHGSGRNSVVLHAGLYYKPESLKAKVCVPGAKRLKQWRELLLLLVGLLAYQYLLLKTWIIM